MYTATQVVLRGTPMTVIASLLFLLAACGGARDADSVRISPGSEAKEQVNADVDPSAMPNWRRVPLRHSRQPKRSKRTRRRSIMFRPR